MTHRTWPVLYKTEKEMDAKVSNSLGLLPQPVSCIHKEAVPVHVSDGYVITHDPQLRDSALVVAATLQQSYGLAPGRITEQGPVSQEKLSAHEPLGCFDFTLDSSLPLGGYRLIIQACQEVGAGEDSRQGLPHLPLQAHVNIAAADKEGAFSAVATLKQLLGSQAYRRAPLPDQPARLPQVDIEDQPAMGWRGMHLDVSRHFRTKAEVLRFIDLLAEHKYNVFHFHLTDDQGWRIEVDAFPKLAEIASWRRATELSVRNTGTTDIRPHGGYYTRADLREIAEYGRRHGVSVIPEIDLPGHSQALLTAYPELAAREQPGREVWTTWGITEDVLNPSQSTVDFFVTILDQVIEDMSPEVFHIGGDEVPEVAWQDNPDIVQQAQDLGYVLQDGTGDVHQLHGWFLLQLANHLRSQGVRCAVWDEAFSDQLPKDAIVMVWRQAETAQLAINAGHDVVLAMMNNYYFDWPASQSAEEPWHFGAVTTVEDVYASDLSLFQAHASSESDNPDCGFGRVLGVQGQLWTEHMDTVSWVDYSMFPRACALAEIAWSAGQGSDRSPGSAPSQEFISRLIKDHLPRLDAAGVDYRPMDGPKPWQRHPQGTSLRAPGAGPLLTISQS